MMIRHPIYLLVLLFTCFCHDAIGAITVVDDTGQTVSVPDSGARRIISMSPHTTEILYAIGAGPRVVGVTKYSNYPKIVSRVPVVGDFKQIDLEKMLSLRPDLIILWDSSSLKSHMHHFKKLGIGVFLSHPKKLSDIADTMRRFGVLTRMPNRAATIAHQWQTNIEHIRQRYANKRLIDTFFLVSDKPLFTLSDQHLMHDVFEICRVRNIFSDLPVIAPSVNREAVLTADPQAIVSTSLEPDAGFSSWRRLTRLQAVRKNNLFFINPDWLNRASPRMILGIQAMCRAIDTARHKTP